MIRLRRIITLVAAASAAASWASTQSATYTTSGTNPATHSNLAAQSEFSLDNGFLSIDLTNTGAPGLANSDALMALLFTLNPGVSLTPYAASLGTNASFTNTPDADLGQEWGYASGFSLTNGQNAGVSASGLGIFSHGNFAADGKPLQGVDYGITNGVGCGANKPYKSAILVNNSIHLVLNAPQMDLSDISNVAFQFGTSLCEPRLPGVPDDPNTPPVPPVNSVPEPGSMALLAIGALAMGPAILRRRS